MRWWVSEAPTLQKIPRQVITGPLDIVPPFCLPLGFSGLVQIHVQRVSIRAEDDPSENSLLQTLLFRITRGRSCIAQEAQSSQDRLFPSRRVEFEQRIPEFLLPLRIGTGRAREALLPLLVCRRESSSPRDVLHED